MDPSGTPNFPILRGKFRVHQPASAELYVLGLGFFHVYINGKEVTDQKFLPLFSDFEPRQDYPKGEKLSGHRIYVPHFDITPLLAEGENTIAIHFGGGWYASGCGKFGDPKAIYRICVTDAEGKRDVVSSEADVFADSFVKTYHLTTFEAQDYRNFDDRIFGGAFDDSALPHCQCATPPAETEYLFSDCPTDRVIRTLTPRRMGTVGDAVLYDCGVNASSYPVLHITAPEGEEVRVDFSEELLPDGDLDSFYGHGQTFSVISDGKGREVEPQFLWYGCRYLRIRGGAEPVAVKVVHAAVPVTGTFSCDNETLNWLSDTFTQTQLYNMHAGIPSDCPHIERRGYTGDGELACHAVMTILGAQAFYRKWIDDISDCQDRLSGHVQYTAPYICSGGGPGGWGCAIVEVPYRYYLHYGDTEPMQRLYPQMLRYFDFLNEHSTGGLVTSDQAGCWCLGDWCTTDPVILPPSFVNTYFYVRSLQTALKIARIIGKNEDLPRLEAELQTRKAAMTAVYFDLFSHDFFSGVQGADAFAIDIGLGDERTYPALVERYEKLGTLDTGIFGTEILTRVLFSHGDADLALRLLTSQAPASFEGMRRDGATTLWEYWPHTGQERSHNHPMFGAAVASLFDFVLGIRDAEEGGYRSLLIAPVENTVLRRASGTREIPQGRVSVSYEKKEDGTHFTIEIPDGVPALFRYGDVCRELSAGTNHLTV